MSKKVLITGFEPFGGESMNPAWEAVAAMKEENTGAELVKLRVPVTFAESIPVIYEAMKQEQPDVVLCVGQAGGRSAVTPERVAINLDDARSGDNAGVVHTDVTIMEDGPAAYFATVPVKAMVEAIKAEGIPAMVSNTAGLYVCNHVMYGILYHMEQAFPHMRGGFIHVPYCTEQVLDKPGQPSMALRDITTALEACVKACVAEEM